MLLSEKNQIQPGIYRTKFAHIHGVPNLRESSYADLNITEITQELIKKDMCEKGLSNIVIGNEPIIETGVFPKRTYFSSIEDFLGTWRRGYELNISQFGYNSVYEKLGFELFYVNWDKTSEFFKFGNHKGIKYIGKRADLNPIIILADNNGMNDQNGFLNLGINDFRTEKVLVYRDDESEKENEFKDSPKILRDDRLYYFPFDEKDKFPFESPNPLKSMSNNWTMIGISPLEVYFEVEKLGFVFPK